MDRAVQDLNSKAGRSWFAISNVIYKHNRMEVSQACNIFDSLVTPVALYNCELYLPYIILKKSFDNSENLLRSWEKFSVETINQKFCRILLSVQKKRVVLQS